jgi:septum formation protein
LLENAGLTVNLMSPGVDEALVKPSLIADGLNPRDIADALAEMKAIRASNKTSGLVLGADQTLDLDGQLIDKAESLEELRETLLRLRGRDHQLHCALVIAQAGRPIWRALRSARLRVRSFSEDWLDHYIERCGVEVMSSVGGYHLEGLGVQLFERVDGDYFTILGLPLVELLDYLRIQGELDQ